MIQYAYRLKAPSWAGCCWYGAYDSRVLAAEAAREGAEKFVMVWTAEIIELTLGDLVRGGPLLPWLSERSDYKWHFSDIPDGAVADLEDGVGALIDNWATEHGRETKVRRYGGIEPDFYNIDYESAYTAWKGRDKTYSDDAPVQSETQYTALVGRIARFKKQRKRVDLKGVSLDTRTVVMKQAMLVWDAQFPLPGLYRYEKRVKEIKRVLRSPWLPLATYLRDENGLRSYNTDHWSEQEHADRERYRLLQRELQWLKVRLTDIYAARVWARKERRSHFETVASTGASAG